MYGQCLDNRTSPRHLPQLNQPFDQPFDQLDLPDSQLVHQLNKLDHQ